MKQDNRDHVNGLVDLDRSRDGTRDLNSSPCLHGALRSTIKLCAGPLMVNLVFFGFYAFFKMYSFPINAAGEEQAPWTGWNTQQSALFFIYFFVKRIYFVGYEWYLFCIDLMITKCKIYGSTNFL